MKIHEISGSENYTKPKSYRNAISLIVSKIGLEIMSWAILCLLLVYH